MDIRKRSLEKHYEWGGKIEVISRPKISTREDLSLAYTPGVAEPCLAIKDNPELSFSLTRRSNLVAVVTDGTAVLGLGDIGPLAGMPVMEGKCALFKEFADVDAFPICVNSKDVEEIVKTVALIGGSFGGISVLSHAKSAVEKVSANNKHNNFFIKKISFFKSSRKKRVTRLSRICTIDRAKRSFSIA